MADTSTRMLRLLSLLQTHRYWAGSELVDRLGVSPRTLRRDVERLRELGYPVDASRGIAGGYQLQAGAALPPLILDDEEAVAIAVGLQAAAGGAVAGLEESAVQALTKILAVMPPKLRRRMEAVRASTMPSPGYGPVIDATALTVMAQACRDGVRLRFSYSDKTRTTTARHVEPHRLVALHSRWYLVGYDLDRDDWRTFRVDRIGDPESTRFPSRERELPADDAVAYVRQGMRRIPRRYDVRVLVGTDATTVARQVMGWGHVAPVSATSCRLTMAVDGLEWPLLVLAELDADFEVESPPELAARVAAVAARFSRAG